MKICIFSDSRLKYAVPTKEFWMFEHCHTLFALEELAAYTYIYLHVHISAQGAYVARRRLLTYADVC